MYKTEKLVKGAIVKHWWAGDHAPYRGTLHDLTTDKPEVEQEIDEFFNKLPDRTPIRITIEITGEPVLESPKWILLRPNHYGPETDAIREKSEHET